MVIAVADGDTLTVQVDQQRLKVRLADIDAPESKQAFGDQSRREPGSFLRDDYSTRTDGR